MLSAFCKLRLLFCKLVLVKEQHFCEVSLNIGCRELRKTNAYCEADIHSAAPGNFVETDHPISRNLAIGPELPASSPVEVNLDIVLLQLQLGDTRRFASRHTDAVLVGEVFRLMPYRRARGAGG